MTVEQAFSLVTAWLRRFAAIGLLVYIVLYVAKLYGINVLPQVATYGPQETGILLAGLAFALGKA